MTFLATTALSEFWDPNDELLFLGTWCLPRDGSVELGDRVHPILPSPWDDQAEFERAVAYLTECYERILALLSDYLNAALDMTHTARYWRIVIGPWLLEYLQPFYDRYRRVITAKERVADLKTIVMSSDSWILPRDTHDVANLISNDPYNLQLCSQIVQSLGLPCSERPYKATWLQTTERGSIASAASAARRATWELVLRESRRLLAQRMRVALFPFSASPSVLCQLTATTWLRACPVTIDRFRASPRPVFDGRRLGLARLAMADEFEHVFVQSLPNALPAIYLEGFRELSAQASSVAWELPNVVASASWIFDEPLKFVAAAATERGTRLLAAQHGGGYGLLHNFPVESHERAIADRYYTWGWASEGRSNLANLPSLKLASRKPRDPWSPRSGNCRRTVPVLLVGTSHHRYLFRFHSAPSDGQWQQYLKDQVAFLKALPSGIRANVVVRLGRPDYLNAAALLRCQVPHIRFDQSKSFLAVLKKAELVVVDHPMTTFIEALHLNVPTLLFWDATRWVARAEATPFLDELGDAGILHPSPAQAADKLAEVRPHLAAWWGATDVQRARHRFVERYAWSPRQWRGAWRRALDEEASAAARAQVDV